MKKMKIKKILLSALLVFGLVSCSSGDEVLNSYKEEGRYIEITFDQYIAKKNNYESFIFFVKKGNCSSCKKFYGTVKTFFETYPDFGIFYIDYDEMYAQDRLTMASHFSSCLGKDYYLEREFVVNELYTPSVGKVIQGELVDAFIGNQSVEELSYLYQVNYISFDYYYNYTRKTANKDSFKMFFSLKGDQEYDTFLRNYYQNNKNYVGYYMDCSKFDESDLDRLLNRINYIYDEESKLDKLPNYFYLEYDKGLLKTFEEGKYDEDSLNSLYSSN